MEKVGAVKHLLVTVFLWDIAGFMVIPAITDVTMAALCPFQLQCSFAIYLTGFQQAIIGLGAIVVLPVIGNLSDVYGRKSLLTFPMTLSIIPLVIMAYSRTKYYYYAYYLFKTLAAMISDGSIHCLALAYVADNTKEENRVATYGILSGVRCGGIFSGAFAARFLSTAHTFQVAALVSMISVVYMSIFLEESNSNNITTCEDLTQPILKNILDNDDGQLDTESSKRVKVSKKIPSPSDISFLLKSSSTFSQATIVVFFSSLAAGGLQSSLLYFYKAQFQFDKDQFADLTLITTLAGTVSQLFLMPKLSPVVGEERLLSIGILAACLSPLLNSIAWSVWVPYAVAPLSVLSMYADPCLTSIVSKQVEVKEQRKALNNSGLQEPVSFAPIGMAQGCILGISSFGSIISPLIFSPLTALFLSDKAPFSFPGFSIMCTGLTWMIALVPSLMISRKRSNNITQS